MIIYIGKVRSVLDVDCPSQFWLDSTTRKIKYNCDKRSSRERKSNYLKNIYRGIAGFDWWIFRAIEKKTWFIMKVVVSAEKYGSMNTLFFFIYSRSKKESEGSQCNSRENKKTMQNAYWKELFSNIWRKLYFLLKLRNTKIKGKIYEEKPRTDEVMENRIFIRVFGTNWTLLKQ